MPSRVDKRTAAGSYSNGSLGSLSDAPTICLVRPPAVETFRFATTSLTPPLGLAYIAGALESAGERVAVVDAVASAPDNVRRYFKGYLIGLSFDEIAARIPDGVDFIGISVVFTHEWPAVVCLIEAIKQRHPDVQVVLGGEHISSMPEFCLRTSVADALVLGEGEETVIELLHALRESHPLDEIHGIAYRSDDDVVVNPRRQRASEIDDIAWPAWHLFALDTYHEHRWMGGMYSSTKSVPILATRGCPYQCTYCSAPNMWTPRWIPRDPAKVVDEIQYYVEHFGARNFPFQDLTAIIRREWIVDFCNRLLDRGLQITWQMPTGTRSEAIDAEVAELLRRTGMISMAYAPESGSEETRRLIKKKMKTDRLFQSMRAAVAEGLNVSVFLVIGFPHDTEDHLRENFAFLDAIADIGITDVAVGFYMALPGTQMFDSLYDNRKIVINRKYFRHILAATSLWSTSTYNEHFSKLELTVWKFRLFRRFYQHRRAEGDSRSLASSLWRSVSHLRRKGGDDSKFQTAFRNGVVSGIETAKCKLQRGWMSRADEERFFESWDDIFREIREKNVRDGIHTPAPADTRQLHEINVIQPLRAEHAARRRIPVKVVG
ncbi:MAG: B12-binding domain-containing radical SAM protein [Acidimicrobiales bacterium]